MTEQMLLQPSQETEVIETPIFTALHRAELTASALTGFMIMEAVDGPWEFARHEMKKRVIEQDRAVDATIDALDISEARLATDMRPKANLVYLGPSGTGKTETATALAEILGDGEPNLVTINCTEYSQGHEVANLTGSPAGYIGHSQATRFSKELIEKPGTVLLFDEIEKGSKELYNLMLQIMDKGVIQLSNGDMVYFKNTVLIMTSNLGAKEMADQLNPARLGFRKGNTLPDRSDIEGAAKRALGDFFKTEFIGRIDKSVVFHPLSSEGLTKVLDSKLTKMNAAYETQYGARLSLSDATKSQLVHTAELEPHLGARPLIHAFEQEVLTTFGKYLGAQAIPEGTHVRVFHPAEAPFETDSLVFTAEADQRIRKAVVPEVVVEEAPAEPEIRALPAGESKPEGGPNDNNA